ncbi:MAG: DUF4433 domain-containing protein [Deltaproteobacteria bacterium]|nr:DUF4433 domain-containing protein [Deltaproteobacteria bacterium]
MSMPPANQQIYHITHVDNLSSIVTTDMIESDARRITEGVTNTSIGMTEIKRRRLQELEVHCHPGTMVGQYVPFYFCPRSIMLYILYMGNHPDLNYREGQRPVVHLQADLAAIVQWAQSNGVRWAFSDRNAGAYFAEFYNTLDDLDKVNWDAVAATDFRDMVVKEGKQAEFLVYESFPWKLVNKVGVFDTTVEEQVKAVLRGANHTPLVRVEGGWYY